MSKPELSTVQSDANDKVNEFADDDKTTGADWESAILRLSSVQKQVILVNNDNAP